MILFPQSEKWFLDVIGEFPERIRKRWRTEALREKIEIHLVANEKNSPVLLGFRNNMFNTEVYYNEGKSASTSSQEIFS